MTFTAATTHARLRCLRRIEQDDPNVWAPPPAGYISRATRYTALRRELYRRLVQVPSEMVHQLREGV